LIFSFKAVEALRRGLKPLEAAEEALGSIKNYYPHYVGAVVVLSVTGEYGAACHGIATFPFAIAHGSQPTKIVTINC